MRLPYLQATQEATKKYSVVFRGINLGEGYVDGEFMDSTNISSEMYPCITQRAARIKEGQYNAPSALHAKEGLLLVDDTTVYYNGVPVGIVSAGKKQIATVGNYIVIFPDKVYYDVANNKFAAMEETYTATGLVFTSNSITTTGNDFGFRVGDAVAITGCTTAPENNKTPVIRSISGKTLTFSDNAFTAATETGSVTIKRKVPDLDYICESNYRLWGTNGNTIFASKYSDPLNFFVHDGLVGDSYNIEVATDGEFTGCIPYSSHLCFFKEHTLHKMYGSKPSNFQLVTGNVYGVQEGCANSMCIVNEQLLYKGVNGIYSYTGGVPELISEKFAMKRFSEATAACDGERYYVSMKSTDGWHLYVYDVLRNLWIREDDTHALDMAFSNGYIYFTSEDGGLYKIDRDADRGDVEWSVTFCPFNETMNERKGYSKFHLRVDMEAGAWLSVDMKTERDLKWEKIHTSHNERARTVTIPIIPTRCDSVTLKVYGKGKCLIKAFVREFTTGSDA